jgi:hypothetical protein
VIVIAIIVYSKWYGLFIFASAHGFFFVLVLLPSLLSVHIVVVLYWSFYYSKHYIMWLCFRMDDFEFMVFMYCNFVDSPRDKVL